MSAIPKSAMFFCVAAGPPSVPSLTRVLSKPVAHVNLFLTQTNRYNFNDGNNRIVPSPKFTFQGFGGEATPIESQPKLRHHLRNTLIIDNKKVTIYDRLKSSIKETQWPLSELT